MARVERAAGNPRLSAGVTPPAASAGFLNDVVAGLSLPQKALAPKYFYDAEGSRLFEAICKLPAYYPTRAELSLTREHVEEIARFAHRGCELIEYGSGASVKSRLLIAAMRPARYVAIDISASALAAAERRLRRAFPWLTVRTLEADFSRPLALPRPLARTRRVAYFPGSTIGNLTPQEAVAFLRMTRSHVGRAGAMLVGVDLKKDANILHAAYNDPEGVTAAFNLNLLARINRELHGHFDLRAFRHYAFYNATAGRIEMHLVSLERQRVAVGPHRFGFDAGETIHTENSYKYSVEEFRQLAVAAGYRAQRCWFDRKRRFALHGLIAA